MKKRIFILFTIIGLTVSILIFPSLFKEKVLESIRTTGIVEGVEVNITSKISGKIGELCCMEGDYVKADSVVATIDSEELKAAVRQANASVQRAMADIQTSEANIEVAKARLEEAKRHFERTKALYRENLIPQANLEQAVADFDSASAIYKASTSQLSSIKAHLEEARARLDFQKARLDDTVIKTPISGTVVYRALETGEFVSPGATILTIVNMDNLWVRIDIEETLLGFIRLDSEAIISIDTIPEETIKGKISEIGRYAEFATQRDVKHGQHDIKTFHVKIKIEDPDKVLKPGMTVDVEIPIKHKVVNNG